MKNLQALINEASINAKKRNVRFTKELMLNGKNLGNIGNFVIFTGENPNSIQADKKTNKKLLDALKTELKQAHYVSMPIDGYFAGNKEHSLLVFNMKLEVAQEFNAKYNQTSFFYVEPKKSEDGFVAQYWEKTDDSKPVDRVKNPYVKKGETDIQHEGADAEGNYSIISNDYKFYFDASMFETANDTIEQGLNVLCEKYNIEDKAWLLDYITNGTGFKRAVWRGQMFKD
jgi:hypothetical protein